MCGISRPTEIQMTNSFPTRVGLSIWLSTQIQSTLNKKLSHCRRKEINVLRI